MKSIANFLSQLGVIFIKTRFLHSFMAEAAIEHMHEDIELMKKDLAVIKHILSQEGELSDWTKEQLAKARKEPASSYTDLDNV